MLTTIYNTMDSNFTNHRKNVIILTCWGEIFMKIGIDIDGVLTDINSFQAKEGKKFFNDELHYFNECAYDFKDMFHCTYEEKKSFWRKNCLNYYIKPECEKYASEVTKMLHEQGHTIYLFSSRSQTNKKGIIGNIYKELLKHWLEKNKIIYDEIIYCDPEKSAEDKFYECQKKEIDIMIEDQKFSAYLESNVSKVILISRLYNLGLELNNIVRVNSFEDIYKSLLIKEQKGEQNNEYKKKTI